MSTKIKLFIITEGGTAKAPIFTADCPRPTSLEEVLKDCSKRFDELGIPWEAIWARPARKNE